MSKVKILEVTQIDLIGRRFNGYNMIYDLDQSKFDIKQAVILKESNDKNVIEILNTIWEKQLMEKYIAFEEKLSIKNVLSISSPSLLKMKEYQEADIIHFHQFHNANLSIPYLRKIASEKKVIISLHDPWFLTGHCVHFYDCDKWKTGCVNCPNLTSFFPVLEDHCHDMWQLKKSVFKDLDVDIVVSSDWMLNLVNQSPVFGTQKRVHKIPFGLDYKKFNSVTKEKARKHFGISNDAFVFFVRTQSEFKGTPYVLEALKKLETKKEIVVLTCEVTNMLDEVKDKFTIKDLGLIDDKEMIYAMNSCDVFLMPSIAESFGLMAIEAMACGKPVIVFNNTALPSVTHAPECGYLVNNRDADDLMKKMKYAIDNPKDVERRGKMASSIVKKEYTNEVYNRKLEDLYTDVSHRKKKIKEIDLEIKADENTNQLKFLLNDLTVRSFGTSHPISKELLYNLKGIKRKKNYTFSFSEQSVQDLLIDYTTRIHDYCEEYKIKSLINTNKVKIEKITYFIKNNPGYFKKVIKRILSRFKV